MIGGIVAGSSLIVTAAAMFIVPRAETAKKLVVAFLGPDASSRATEQARMVFDHPVATLITTAILLCLVLLIPSPPRKEDASS